MKYFYSSLLLCPFPEEGAKSWQIAAKNVNQCILGF